MSWHKKKQGGKKAKCFWISHCTTEPWPTNKKNQCCTKDSRVTFTLNNPLLSQQSHISFIVLHYSHITSGMLRINHGQAVHVKSFITAFKMFLFWNRHEITKKELERNCISSENRGVWRWAKFHFPCAVVNTSNWISKDFKTYSDIHCAHPCGLWHEVDIELKCPSLQYQFRLILKHGE